MTPWFPMEIELIEREEKEKREIEEVKIEEKKRN